MGQRRTAEFCVTGTRVKAPGRGAVKVVARARLGAGFFGFLMGPGGVKSDCNGIRLDRSGQAHVPYVTV